MAVWKSRLVLAVVLAVGLARPVRAGDRDPYAQMLRRVGQLLPKVMPQVAMIDANEATPDVRAKLLTLDAFVTTGGTVVYLVEQSLVLQHARRGEPFYEHMLASIIWHEMAHIAGADERGARLAEETLWTRFVRDGVCNQMTALRYLKALNERPGDDRMAVKVAPLATR